MRPPRWPNSASCRRKRRRSSGTRAAPRPSTSPASTRSRRTTKHDVIAFLTHLSEIVGPEARFVHQGMTSSDVLDTTLVGAARARRRHPDRRSRRPARRAQAPRLRAQDTPSPSAARTASMPSRPPSASSWPRPMPSSRATASASSRRAQEIATCAISGAIGTFANIDPRVEAYVAEKLGLAVEPVSTQVIPRDRHAMYLRDARRHRLVDRARRDRNPPPAAHRSARSRGVLLARPEGLVGDAAQAQPGADRKPHRPRPPGARHGRAGARERRALARARHLAFVGRAHDRSRRDRHARLRARPPHRA